MVAGGILSADNCVNLEQLVEHSFADPVVTASADLTAARASALRRCFYESMSRELEARNAAVVPVPDIIWLLIMDLLPLDDLLSVSCVCRPWRSIALAHSRLWTRLTLRVQERGPGYLTNIETLWNIVPRSGSQLLELDVQMDVTARSHMFGLLILDFLPMVAPRLVALHIVSRIPWLAGPVVSYLGTLPELRTLAVLPPPEGCSGCNEDFWDMHLQGDSMPKLVDLALHSDLRVSFSGAWPAIRSLRCTSNELVVLQDLILSARGLQCFVFEWKVDPNASDDSINTPPSAALVDALRAVPDVDLTLELAPMFLQFVFGIFGCSSARHLRLTFELGDDYDGPLSPLPCCRLSSAVSLTLSQCAEPDPTMIVLVDGSGRATEIILREHSSIDWALVPSLDSLDVLSLDACLWPSSMLSFPECPRLSEVVLAVRTRAEIQALLAADSVHTPLPRARTLKIAGLQSSDAVVEDARALHTALGATRLSIISQ